MLEFLQNKTLPMPGLRFNGAHSWLDWSMTIKEIQLTPPKLKEITETVPFMDGEYNFSRLAGYPTYTRRYIDIIFTLYGQNRNELAGQGENVMRWLLSEPGGSLVLDDELGYTYQDVYARITSYTLLDDGVRLELGVQFDCAPYRAKGTYDEPLMLGLTASEGGAVYVDKYSTEALCAVFGTPDIPVQMYGDNNYIPTATLESAGALILSYTASSSVTSSTLTNGAGETLAPSYTRMTGARVLLYFFITPDDLKGGVLHFGGYYSGIDLEMELYVLEDKAQDGHFQADLPLACTSPFTVNGAARRTLQKGFNFILPSADGSVLSQRRPHEVI